MTDTYTNSLSVSTAATTDPVTWPEIMDHLRIDTTDEQAYIMTLVASATEWCQRFTGRQFVDATLLATYPDFPTAPFRLPRPPLDSVTSITYLDTDIARQTFDSSNYHVLTAPEPGIVNLNDGVDWPDYHSRPGSIEVTYVAGYGTASDVPAPIKAAIKLLTAHWFEQREPIITGTVLTKVPFTVESLLWQYRVVDFQ